MVVSVSGWIVLTFDPIEGDEWALRFSEDNSDYLSQTTELSKDYEQIKKALCRKLMSYDSIQKVGIDSQEVYAYYSYGSGVGCEEIIQETSEMWDRVVLLQTNDTGDTGTAILYENQDGSVEVTDEYEESQCTCCGGRTGRLAAAYMLTEHHIHALADFYDTPYEKFETKDEIEQI